MQDLSSKGLGVIRYCIAAAFKQASFEVIVALVMASFPPSLPSFLTLRFVYTSACMCIYKYTHIYIQKYIHTYIYI